MSIIIRLLPFFLFFCSCAYAQQAPIKITVDLKPAAEIQPTMWGIFFEDINFAADGGIYAELIKNRSFEFAVPLMGWTQENTQQFSLNLSSGSALVINEGLGRNNPRFARVTTNADSGYSLLNEGFAGMGVKQNVQYNLTVVARKVEGNVPIRISLIDSEGKALGATVITPDSKEWKTYSATLNVSKTTPNARMRMTFRGKGVTDLDFVSMFPSDTWKNRPGGLRADLEKLEGSRRMGKRRRVIGAGDRPLATGGRFGHDYGPSVLAADFNHLGSLGGRRIVGCRVLSSAGPTIELAS